MNSSKLSKDNIVEIIKQGNFIAEKSADGTIFLLKKSKQDVVKETLIPTLATPKFILNQILHAEMRIPRKNINEWMCEIEPYFFINDLSNIENFAVAMNQFGLILVCVNFKKEAIDFCEKLIFLYHAIAKLGISEFYLIQPYVNLIRLYRLQHDYIKMERSLKILSGFQDNTKVGNIMFHLLNKINKNTNHPKNYAALIANVKIIESIKAALEQKNFEWIIQKLSPKINAVIAAGEKISNVNYSYQAEALIIAYHHLGRLKEAYNICYFFLKNGVIAEIQVFSYRIAELYLSLKWETAFKQEINKLYRYAEQCLTKHPPILTEVIFAFSILNLLEEDSQKETLLTKMIYCFKQMQEEVGVITCLKKLVIELKLLKYNLEYTTYLKDTGYISTRADRTLPKSIEVKIKQLLNLFQEQYSRFSL